MDSQPPGGGGYSVGAAMEAAAKMAAMVAIEAFILRRLLLCESGRSKVLLIVRVDD